MLYAASDLLLTTFYPRKTKYIIQYSLIPLLLKTFFSEGRELRDSPTSSGSPRPEPTQEVTPLLLLSIFAIAARFTDDDLPNPFDNKMWEAGCEYLDNARKIAG